MNIGKETFNRALKDDKLLSVMYGLVIETKVAGKYYKPISIRILELRIKIKKGIGERKPSDEYTISLNKEVNICIALELCAIVRAVVTKKTGLSKLEVFNSTKGKYESYVTMLLRNAIVSEHKRKRIVKGVFIHEGGLETPNSVTVPLRDTIVSDWRTDGFNDEKFNRRRPDKIKPKLVIIEELPSEGGMQDELVNEAEVIRLFQEFYGEDIINALIDGLKYNVNYPLKSAIHDAGRGSEYEKLKKRFYRNGPKFIALLEEKGVKINKTKHGVYFSYDKIVCRDERRDWPQK